MRSLNLVIKLIGLSALLLGSVIGSFVLMSIVGFWLLMGLSSPGGTNISFLASGANSRLSISNKPIFSFSYGIAVHAVNLSLAFLNALVVLASDE